MKTMCCRSEIKITAAAFVILLACVFCACSDIAIQEDGFFTMDTYAETTVITKKAETGKKANEKIREICGEVEGQISKTVETSEIYRLNEFLKSEDFRAPFPLSEKTAGLLEYAKYAKEQTSGAFDPALGELVGLWGINDLSADHKLPEKDDFYPALERVHNFGYKITRTAEGCYIEMEAGSRAELDLGGIGKGHAADEISGYLVEAGISHALVSFGSSVLAAGKNKAGNLWTVGITDPLNPEKQCGYISATDKFISVSGGYERFVTIGGIDYCHIIDPETGYPVDNDLLCVAVVTNAPSPLQDKSLRERFSDNGALSDALSTALYVMGKQQALKFYNTSSLDFEMILFVKTETEPGYEIIPTNVMFTELKY
ncbi:MAG: FAD:protein FMN transferase [Oscillospiraceae bacterium]|nr:FAD:protein FMN transferase [Oscillospiraceae bacterium]